LYFSLGVRDAPGEVGVLGEPSMAETRLDLELCDAVGGSGDPAVGALEGWLAVSRPRTFGVGLDPC
jgi:hypothetical protein